MFQWLWSLPRWNLLKITESPTLDVGRQPSITYFQEIYIPTRRSDARSHNQQVTLTEGFHVSIENSLSDLLVQIFIFLEFNRIDFCSCFPSKLTLEGWYYSETMFQSRIRIQNFIKENFQGGARVLKSQKKPCSRISGRGNFS